MDEKLNQQKISKTFCSLPWMSLSTNPSGTLRVCCASLSDENLIRGSDNKPFQIYDSDLKSVWHSEFYQKLRKQFLNGEKPKICQFCFEKEKAGIKSVRMAYNSLYKKENFNRTKITPPLKQIKYLDIRIGNTCNLKCRMCSPYSSSLWVKDWKLLSKENISPDILKFTLKDKEQYEISASLFKKMDYYKWIENLPQLKEIYFTGGEPLLIEEYKHLLMAVIERGLSSQISLKYSTNLTRLPPEVLNYWQHFKKVQLKISLDGFKELNHYIRYPARWQDIENNLLAIEAFKTKNLNLKIDCTIQMYNILKLKPLLHWVEKKDYPIFFNILDKPRFLNIRVLPQNLKRKAEQDLSPFQKRFDTQSIVSYMNSKDNSQYLKEFFIFTKYLDQKRNQNLFSFVPELAEYQNLG